MLRGHERSLAPQCATRRQSRPAWLAPQAGDGVPSTTNSRTPLGGTLKRAGGKRPPLRISLPLWDLMSATSKPPVEPGKPIRAHPGCVLPTPVSPRSRAVPNHGGTSRENKFHTYLTSPAFTAFARPLRRWQSAPPADPSGPSRSSSHASTPGRECKRGERHRQGKQCTFVDHVAEGDPGKRCVNRPAKQ